MILTQEVNPKYKEMMEGNARYYINMGGRAGARSKTSSQYAVKELTSVNYFRCAIMRYVLSDVRNSIYQDVLDTIQENGLENLVHARENPMGFFYAKNKIDGMAFKKSSGDHKAKLKSLSGYNCIIIEEADEVSEEDFMQLDDSLRTSKGGIKIILNFNPPHKNHWLIKRFFNLVPSEVEGYYRAELKKDITDAVFTFATYKDNLRNLNAKTVENYERYKITKPDHYYNMICGLVSEGVRGRIYKNWIRLTDEEFEALPYPKYYGLDFGYTNDPTALIEIKEHNNKIYFRELIYETGLTNPLISKRMEQLGISKDDPIYADSAEPKSIQELQDDGWNVLPASKGADSVRAGIDFLLEKEIAYTESSINADRETQEYKWALDRNKEPTNDPIDDFNHAMDALRYGVWTHNHDTAGFIGFV